MDKLSRFELKVLRYLDDMVKYTTSKDKAMKELEIHMGLSQEEAIDIYRLWYYNQKEGVDYEELKIDRGDTPLIKFVTKMSLLIKPERESYLDDMFDNHKDELEKIYGDWFHVSCDGWKEKMPSIEWTNKGAELNLSSEDWEEHFSGLDEDSIYRYNEAFDNYGGYYDEMDSEELNYMHSYMNEETIEHLKFIALLAGKSNWPGKNSNNYEDGEVNNFLEKLLPKNHYDDVANEFLSTLSMEVSNVRQNSTKEQYTEEIKYDVSSNCTCGYHCITIPYNDLLYIIKNEEFITLSDLKGFELQDEINLNDQYYDAWLEDEGSDTVTTDLNYVLDTVIEKIGEDEGLDLEELLNQKEEMLDMLNKLGLKNISNTQKGNWYKSSDGKIELFDDHINYKDKKIKFTYEGNSHIVPFDDFPNWVYGSVLDLNESIRYGKKLLNESVENITKISIFDFDGTLMRTPHPEEGKEEWEKSTGIEYPHVGWWSKPESLDDSVFNIQPIKSTVSDYIKELESPNTKVIMMTGRLPHQADQVEELLSLHNIEFEEYHYKDTGDTLGSKLSTIINLLNKFPGVSFIEIWEDRESHAMSFEKWGKENGINIKVNLVK
jgi:hypothetical protein